MIMLGMVGNVDILAEPLRAMGPIRLDIAAVWSTMLKVLLPTRIDRFRTKCYGVEAHVKQSWWETWALRKCANKLRKNKCHKRRVRLNCRRTCGLCWIPGR